MRIVIIILLFASTAAPAAPLKIDFQNYSPGDTGPFNVGGFTISGYGDGPATVYSDDVFFNGYNYLEAVGYYWAPEPTHGGINNAQITLSREDGAAFSIYEANIRSWSYLYLEPVSNAWIMGTRADGSTFYVDSSNEWSDPDSGPDILGVGDWLNVTEVTFGVWQPLHYETTSILLYDVTVGAAVPIPATVWLFGSALAGLAWIRRKQAP